MPPTSGTLAAFQPSIARYMLSGVLPVRDTPSRITSASDSVSGFWPSSWLIA